MFPWRWWGAAVVHAAVAVPVGRCVDGEDDVGGGGRDVSVEVVGRAVVAAVVVCVVLLVVGEDGVGMVGHGGRFAEGVCAAVGEGLGEEGRGHLAVGRAGHGPSA